MRAVSRTLTLYIAIGIVTTLVDLATFRALINVGPLIIAISGAYALASFVQFSLNRYLNFRNFSRSALSQARTYIVVSTFTWVLTALCIEALVRIAHVPPFIAKVITLPASAVAGYILSRHVVFDKGIRALFTR